MSTITDENAQDIIDTAAYGGITYWAIEPTQKDFADAPEGTAATIRDGEEDQVHYLTLDQVKKAYRKLLKNEPRIVGPQVHGYIKDSWAERDEDGIDCGYIDADAADVIVQVAIFGEIVYG
ncbi:hypothetical protein AVT29_gp71 [Streptomyces phage Amela]|uniref:Uncharacterized protein n=1 Tax=Streptomyces phage Amela TaxID=1673877 RepID=A0A0K1Y9P8_9CAUD|nr:hypothetical protein AVT29_gp71 [Streptomyces phage Amela]AKY03826.1 hypothetical protein SEA_AMELA_71 [Streptomyces phage Amela]